MFTIRHCPNYPGERGELFLLATQKRVPFEEGDHLVEEILSAPNHQHIRVVIGTFVVLTQQPTADRLPSQVKNIDPTDILTDSKLWHELPTNSCARISLNRDVETTFSVDKPSYVRLQPFLLIDRT
jgi:hypothetical protein